MSLHRAWLTAALLAAPLGSASGQSPLRSADDPVLRPGDALRVEVWRHPELTGEFLVAPEGTLLHPVYQGVQVAGAPLSVVEERLRDVLDRYDEGVPFTLQPLFPVTVAGEVRQPNLYRLPQGTTIAQAIAQAGGPTELGRLDEVRVIRRDGAIEINLGSGYSRYGALTIDSGDQVLVARRSNFSFVRDVLYPVTSLTAAVAAVLAYSRR